MITLGVREFDGSSDGRRRFCENRSEKSRSLPSEARRNLPSGSSPSPGVCRKSAGASPREVQPPRPGGGTAWAKPSSETGRCNLSSREVAPPELSLRARLGDATSLAEREVAPPELSLRARLGGATSLAERWHRLSSVFELCQAEVQPPQSGGGTASVRRWHRLSQAVAPPELGLRALAGGATTPDRRWHRLELSLRALQGGATASVSRCNRRIPEFRELTVLSSKFELGWSL
uniref:Uncharacterized protein n=1 Tax=Musa acuminata TaxID=4641 RepID=Q1EP13_MUSAC|nr:hypothetical protein MA4_112I10.6 [Musa acuminata]